MVKKCRKYAVCGVSQTPKGNKIREESIWSDRVSSKTEYTYDEQGNMLSETHYGRDGEKSYWIDYTYDAYGNRLSFHSESNEYYWTYTYDAQGKILNERGEGTDGYYYAEYTYDGQGNVLTRKNYSWEGDLDSEVIYEYYDSFAEAVTAGEEYLANKAAYATADSAGWKQAYINKIREYENSAVPFDSFKYALTYLDDDNIPELVAGEPGYYVSLFTYKDGVVYTLMDNEVEGTWGRFYEYGYRSGIVLGFCYDFMEENGEPIGQIDYTYFYRLINHELRYEYVMGIGMYGEDEKLVYYYNGTAITSEQYDQYHNQFYDGKYDQLAGSYTASEMIKQLE